MSFLIFESDPLVRTDIYETLVDAFDDPKILVANTFEDVQAVLSDLRDPIVAILSIPVDALQASATSFADTWQHSTAILIGVDPPMSGPTPEQIVYLPKPFSGEILISTIKNAYSDPLSVQIRKPE